MYVCWLWTAVAILCVWYRDNICSPCLDHWGAYSLRSPVSCLRVVPVSCLAEYLTRNDTSECPSTHSGRHSSRMVELAKPRVEVLPLCLRRLWTLFGLASRAPDNHRRAEMVPCVVVCELHIA
jgi:hypothetical protein